MPTRPGVGHPYMPNAVAEIKDEMLRSIGAKNIESLFEQIPADHRLKRKLDLPDGVRSEGELKRHLMSVLSKNETCEQNLSFLGGDCWQHFVPAVCDEIVNRSEFLTPVWGTPSSDHGRNQAWFEYCSQLGELLNMEMVGLPVYSWACASGHAIRMASRLTRRNEVLVPRSISPERLSVIRNYCEPPEMANAIKVVLVDYDKKTGLLNLDDLKKKASKKAAAVYIENPSFIGVIESQGAKIVEIAHAVGAEAIVGIDAISLGVLTPPADYGADIVTGTTQPLGVHMNCGGGTTGFIASRDDARYIAEYPTLNISITETSKEGEFGFGLSSAHQSSYGMRDKGKDWTGNSTYLWAIANSVYMALLGPDGFREVGELILQRSAYAARRLGDIPGVRVAFSAPHFKEFVVNFDGTGKTVREINKTLRPHKIFGGLDLTKTFPELGNSALYCVTEIHSQADIDRLADTLREAVSK